MDEGFLIFENVTKRFGKQVVLNNLSLSIPHEGILGIIGLSGCGKTTLLNILIGYWKPEGGRVFYNSIPLQQYKRLITQVFGYGTQTGSVYPRLTVEENIYYFARMYNMKRKDIKKRIEELLRLVELEQARNVLGEDLSTGMYRRLDIACAIVHNPRVLLLDEPTGNLDPVLRKHIMNVIKRISEQGTKVIITSHLLGEIEKICDTIAILHQGKIIELGSPSDLKAKYSQEQSVCFETKRHDYDFSIPFLKRMGAKNIFQREDKLYFYTKDAERILGYVLQALKERGDELIFVDVNKPSLEEVFEAATRR